MQRFLASDLISFAAELLCSAGVSKDRATVIAEILVEADLMGHDTHGLAQLPAYLSELANGNMTAVGDPIVLQDLGAVSVWDGQWLSGVWLTAAALEVAAERAQRFGLGAVSIRRSHHIACLQAYLPRATERGLMAMITCSDPGAASVAPYQGLDAVFTPDPIAAGIPTSGDPILIDMSASITTNGMAGRLAARGELLPGEWLQDHAGRPSNDPRVLSASGTLLPTGGQDHGHKGYGMALLVEALSQGLSGYGRANAEKRWGASVYVQVFDPAVFAGGAEFAEQTSALVALCHGSRPHPNVGNVRVPGEKALARKRQALAEGVVLFDGVFEQLQMAAKKTGLVAPSSI